MGAVEDYAGLIDAVNSLCERLHGPPKEDFWGGEIEEDGVTMHMIVSDQTPPEERRMFIDCYMNHVTLWSNTFQLQRVDAGPGEVFKKPELRR